MKFITDNELIDKIINKFYKGGKGKECELCRMHGIKKKAFREIKIDNIDYFVCYNCFEENRIKGELK